MKERFARVMTGIAMALAAVLVVGAAGSLASPRHRHRAGPAARVANPRVADSVPGIPGLPTGVQRRPRPPGTLPAPPSGEWPFPSAFSHTEGSGRLERGASLWTDFVYDDHGPFGSPVGIAPAPRPPTWRRFTAASPTPPGPADQNGADIFTAAVGYTPQATYWRVDWNTLATRSVPVAEWTMPATRRPALPPPPPRGRGTPGSPPRPASSTR